MTQWMAQWINHKAVYRTAPDTVGLLKIVKSTSCGNTTHLNIAKASLYVGITLKQKELCISGEFSI